jgi:glycosyltransferase involved in cell wall biosynthesis
MTGGSYALVTAAHNERENIERTIEAVLAQTHLPLKWIIVCDGCSDGTEELVQRVAGDCDFVELTQTDRSGGHSFGGKVAAIRLGLRRLDAVERDFFGVLDADVSFDRDYFERLIGRFADRPRLGVAGGSIIQLVDGRLVRRIKDTGSVAGAVQLFRSQCFEDTGGYPMLAHGGEDAADEITARMRGWEVETFPDLEVVHAGWVSAAAGGRIRARFTWGKMNFTLGYHPLFELVRCAFRVIEWPYLIGSAAELAGFVTAYFRYAEPALPEETVRYLRREQLARLASFGRRARDT